MSEELNEAQIDRTIGLSEDRRAAVRAENQVAGTYWGGVEWRIVLTWLVFLAAWGTVIVLGVEGRISLWLGVVVNTVLASTFYMPMHESVHGNISGRVTSMRWLNELVGKLCQPQLLMSHKGHRDSHMKHHAFTNEAGRDPDYFSQGKLSALPRKVLIVQMLNTFLPLFAIFPFLRKLIPADMRARGAAQRNPDDAKAAFRMWLFTHAALLAFFLVGVGPQALVLWYIPARIQLLWLATVFAWYPHHPGDKVGRYVDTRVAVFTGSRFLIRGHDHHALHHLYPRVAHYKLPRLWQEMADDLVAKGVRSEGRAKSATAPILWGQP